MGLSEKRVTVKLRNDLTEEPLSLADFELCDPLKLMSQDLQGMACNEDVMRGKAGGYSTYFRFKSGFSFYYSESPLDVTIQKDSFLRIFSDLDGWILPDTIRRYLYGTSYGGTLSLGVSATVLASELESLFHKVNLRLWFPQYNFHKYFYFKGKAYLRDRSPYYGRIWKLDSCTIHPL